MTGTLIAIEGCDGAGTTTQAELLTKALAERGIPHHRTRQPSDGPVGRMIREILAGGHAQETPQGRRAPAPEAIALLFAADRMDHYEREVEPALLAGKVVVSDRWYHSSFAYNVRPDNIAGTACLQPSIAQNGWWIRELNAFAPRPAVTFFLDVAPEEAARRRIAAGRATELYDDIETQRAVVDRYRRLYLEEPGMMRIDGHRPVGDIARQLYVEVERLVERRAEDQAEAENTRRAFADLGLRTRP